MEYRYYKESFDVSVPPPICLFDGMDEESIHAQMEWDLRETEWWGMQLVVQKLLGHESDVWKEYWGDENSTLTRGRKNFLEVRSRIMAYEIKIGKNIRL